MMTYNPGQDDEDKNGIGDTCDDEFSNAEVLRQQIIKETQGYTL